MKYFMLKANALTLATFLLAACVGSGGKALEPPAPSSSGRDHARQALSAYFGALSSGDYTAGAELYGADLGVLIDSNPDIESVDRAALFEAACTRQLRCLPLRDAIYVAQDGDSRYDFRVEFSNPDGSLFVLGPCCGGNETDMPPVSQFDCAVKHDPSGEYLVMCLPVYVP